VAKELVALQPDVILSHITTTTATLRQQTHTVAIVFAACSIEALTGLKADIKANN